MNLVCLYFFSFLTAASSPYTYFSHCLYTSLAMFAIITGGTQGLGFGMACALAAYGANVVITARTARKVEELWLT